MVRKPLLYPGRITCSVRSDVELTRYTVRSYMNKTLRNPVSILQDAFDNASEMDKPVFQRAISILLNHGYPKILLVRFATPCTTETCKPELPNPISLLDKHSKKTCMRNEYTCLDSLRVELKDSGYPDPMDPTSDSTPKYDEEIPRKSLCGTELAASGSPSHPTQHANSQVPPTWADVPTKNVDILSPCKDTVLFTLRVPFPASLADLTPESALLIALKIYVVSGGIWKSGDFKRCWVYLRDPLPTFNNPILTQLP